MRPHIIAAVAVLQAALSDMREPCGSVIGFSNIILTQEAEEMLSWRITATR